MSLSAPHRHKAFSFSVLSCCLATLVSGTSYDYGFDAAKSHQSKRASDDIVVNAGMPLNDDGSAPVRLEIRDLEKDEDRWSLYILALDMLQYTDQTEPTSWYGITGIHGVPFEPYSGVMPTPGNEETGYCHHEDILFPTWHRAYVSLYEQELCARVQYIATLYDDDLMDRFVAAAADCRAPYFDWAITPSAGGTILPASVGGSPTMNISGPAGTQEIANPLYTYEFKPLDGSVFLDISPWSEWNSTLRNPAGLSPDQPSDNTAVNQNLQDHLVQNQQRLYNLFSSYSNYTIVSNEGWAADTSQYDSFESIHDNVHNLLGGAYGHMTIVPFSAFDPLFFLHHCMIDRIYALWQVLYPDSWITPEVARTNSYTTSVGDVLDASSPLTPFFSSSDGTFWNSDMLRDITSLGYTYPELVGISLSNTSSVSAGRSKVVSSITQSYGTNSVNSMSHGSGRGKGKGKGKGTRQARQNGCETRKSTRSTASVAVEGIISASGSYREWEANVKVQKQALGGPFSMNLDLADGEHVGTVGVFSSPPAFAKLMQMAPGAQYVASTIPLTKMLVDKVSDGALASMDPADVSKYISQNLEFSATTSNGTGVTAAEIPGLSIKIVSTVVQSTTSEDALPIWGEPDFEVDYI